MQCIHIIKCWRVSWPVKAPSAARHSPYVCQAFGPLLEAMDHRPQQESDSRIACACNASRSLFLPRFAHVCDHELRLFTLFTFLFSSRVSTSSWFHWNSLLRPHNLLLSISMCGHTGFSARTHVYVRHCFLHSFNAFLPTSPFTISRDARSWPFHSSSRWRRSSFSPRSCMRLSLPPIASLPGRSMTRLRITRGHARKSRANRAREKIERPRAREGERPSQPAACERSISTCMRNAVAGFSIMWVYKRACTPCTLRSGRRHTHSPSWEH